MGSCVRGLALTLMVATAACAPAKTPEPKAVQSTDDAVERAVQAAYAGWSREDLENPDCSVYFAACVDLFIRKVGLDPETEVMRNPRAVMQTPDPTWLTGWMNLPRDDGRAHITYAALTYAATMRVYFDACRKDADAEIHKRDELSLKLRSDLEVALAIPNSYARLGSLVRLRADLRKATTDKVGPRYDLEVALHDAFVASHKDEIYDLRSLRAPDAATLRPSMSENDERDLYCLSSGLPHWQDPENIPVDYVSVPVDEGAKAELQAKADNSMDLAVRLAPGQHRYSLLTDEPPTPDGAAISVGKDPLGVVSVRPSAGIPLFVKSAAPPPDDAKALVVVLAGTVDEKNFEFDCKETQKIDRVRPGTGSVEYVRECKKRDQTRTLELTLRMSEAPDVPITPGEQLTFLGVVKHVVRKEAKKKGAPRSWQVDTTAEVDVTHVFEIWRDGARVADYFSE